MPTSGTRGMKGTQFFKILPILYPKNRGKRVDGGRFDMVYLVVTIL